MFFIAASLTGTSCHTACVWITRVGTGAGDERGSALTFSKKISTDESDKKRCDRQNPARERGPLPGHRNGGRLLRLSQMTQRNEIDEQRAPGRIAERIRQLLGLNASSSRKTEMISCVLSIGVALTVWRPECRMGMVRRVAMGEARSFAQLQPRAMDARSDGVLGQSARLCQSRRSQGPRPRASEKRRDRGPASAASASFTARSTS